MSSLGKSLEFKRAILVLIQCDCYQICYPLFRGSCGALINRNRIYCTRMVTSAVFTGSSALRGEPFIVLRVRQLGMNRQHIASLRHGYKILSTTLWCLLSRCRFSTEGQVYCGRKPGPPPKTALGPACHASIPPATKPAATGFTMSFFARYKIKFNAPFGYRSSSHAKDAGWT